MRMDNNEKESGFRKTIMRRLVEEKHNHIAKRLVAILTAVVFALGMIYMPTGVYGVETDTTDDSVVTNASETTDETLAPEVEADVAEEGVAPETDADTVAEETMGTEDEEPVGESELASTEAAVGELNEALTVNLDSIDEKEYDGFIYKLEDDVTKKEVKEMESAINDLDESKGQKVEEVIKEELYTADSIETIAEVAEPATIEYIEPDYIVHATEVEEVEIDDPVYEDHDWYLRFINAPYVWSRGMFGNNTIIAVLDSGVTISHPDLRRVSYTAPYNAFNGSSNVADGFGHGTKVTGVIAASYNNNEGLNGVMPNTTIMPVKALNDSGASTISVIIAGLDHVINYNKNNKKKVGVINMSFGGDGNSVSLEAKCGEAVNAGIILVVAAGNEAEKGNPVIYPAAYDCVVSVASVNSAGNPSYFSTYNNYVTVSAYGEDLLLASNTGRYCLDSGTSFSAPQVSAMAALVKQMAPSAGYSEFLRVIKATSVDRGAKGYDPYYGFGLINLGAAYRYMATDLSTYVASLSGKTFTYNGKVKTPRVTVYKANKALSAGYYRASYAAGRKKVGSYRVIVEGVNGYTGTRVLSFNIVPPLVKKIKAPKRGKKKLTVRWNAMSKKQKKKYKPAITGYQVRVSTKSNFSNAKYIKVKGISKTKVTVKKLKRKTKYYMQYRSYKTVGSATYYSKWSSTKKAKTK